jgi:hypothetical protein
MKKSKEEMEATLEILSSRDLMAQIQAAEKSLKKGAKAARYYEALDDITNPF